MNIGARAAVVAWASLAVAAFGLRAAEAEGCPPGMANVLGQFCIDRYEASVDLVDARGRSAGTQSPYRMPAADASLRARSRSGVVPQAYISQVDAAEACEAAGKRLCTDAEWVTACKGRSPTRYPYGDEHVAGRCNDAGASPLRHYHGRDDSVETFGMEAMNDPRLNRVPGSVARTGAFSGCRNAFGVHDMVGNLHEWTAAAGGTFRGGYYLDTRINGEGCEYQTTAHVPTYHDYSIGFRCCKGLGSERVTTMPPRAAAASASRPGRAEHVVSAGETLSGIGVRYGVSVADLCGANGTDRRAPIRPGQRLRLPEAARRAAPAAPNTTP